MITKVTHDNGTIQYLIGENENNIISDKESKIIKTALKLDENEVFELKSKKDIKVVKIYVEQYLNDCDENDIEEYLLLLSKLHKL